MNITMEAKAKNLGNLIHFQAMYMGMDHIAIKLPRMQITLRAWLNGFRVPKKINEIIL